MTTERVSGPVSVAASAPPTPGDRLRAEGLTVGYDQRVVATGLDITVPDGGFTVIVGPNACGKSTVLRALSRLLKPSAGTVLLDGRAIGSYGAKEVARTLGLLPQTSLAPDGITVADLVARGRSPHQSMFRQWSAADEAAVVRALDATGTADISGRPVDELSGGQRQRVWIAMVLAQETPLLLLDEPTTFLDIAHQVELLDLLRRLNHDGNTLVAVLHDLNQACRYATFMIAMRDGRIVAQGSPRDIVTEAMVEDVFGLRCMVVDDPVSHTPLVVPIGTTATGTADGTQSRAHDRGTAR